MLGIIERSVTNRDKEMLLILYKHLVTSHLEYGSSDWSVINKEEDILLENIQNVLQNDYHSQGSLIYVPAITER